MMAGAATVQPAYARDTPYSLAIAEAMQAPEFKDKLGSDVSFFFGA